MNKIFYLSMLILFSTTKIVAQTNTIKYYNACNENKNYFALKGDTVVFKCDSIRLLNAKAYSTLQDAYFRLYSTSNQLVIKTDSAGLIYKNLYEEKSRDYNNLKSTFEQFRINTENHVLAIDTNVLAIKTNTMEAKNQLDSTESLIKSSVKEIKDISNNMWRTKLKAGAVGFLGAALLLLPIIIFR